MPTSTRRSRYKVSFRKAFSRVISLKGLNAGQAGRVEAGQGALHAESRRRRRVVGSVPVGKRRCDVLEDALCRLSVFCAERKNTIHHDISQLAVNSFGSSSVRQPP
jgi:hypothetical protein